MTRRLAIAVGLLSGAALAYEILLIRLFSIVDWHHFTFLVISLALLGYGASGTLIALARERLTGRFETAGAFAAAAFAVSSVAAFRIAQRLAFNSLEIVWNPRQLLLLFVLYLLFAFPFFCAATAIGLALTRHGAEAPRLYRADLLGAGAGALGLTALLFVAHPLTCLQIIAIAGLVSAALFGVRSRRGAVAIVAIGLAIAGAGRALHPLRISEFKELAHARRVPGARVVDERSSPLALLTTVASPAVPFRFAPGLSLNYTGSIPEQLAVFSDGGGMSVITRQPAAMEYAGFTPAAAAYAMRRPGHVAVIGAGGGTHVVAALRRGASRVTAVEIDPQMVDLVTKRFGAYAGHIGRDPRVRIVVAEGRRFIRESNERYGVIEISLAGSIGASAAGAQALGENYLYTVESLSDLIAHLEPNGYLAITRWMQVPPREIVKLFATAVEALERMGMRPERSLAVIRSWNTATLLVKRGALSAEEIAAMRRFCESRSFDLDYAPGVRREETNQYNVLAESDLFDAATEILGDRERFFARYKFQVRPATDERPYFFHFLRLGVLPELLSLRGRGGVPLIEWGYLILIAALVQACIAAVVLIVVPLLVTTRGEGFARGRLVLYFGSIGLAFLFIEIAFIQRLTLFLGHPLYAVAVVLASFLVFAGLGSGVSARLERRLARAVPVGIAVVAIIELFVIRFLAAQALGLATPVKIAIAIATIAPLAFLMGMPFPIGLRRLAGSDARAIPWAWGVNGTASVLSSMLATLIAVHAGVSAVIAVAAGLYLVAGGSVATGE